MENVYVIISLFLLLSMFAYFTSKYYNTEDKIEDNHNDSFTIESKAETEMCKKECSSKCKKKCTPKIKEASTPSSVEENIGKKNVNKYNTRKKSS